MSQVAFLVDTPQVTLANSPSYVSTAEELVLLVRKQLPVSDGVRLNRIVTSTTDLFATAATKAVVVAGAAAGAHTVTGILATSKIDKVYHLDLDATPTIASAVGAASPLTITIPATAELKSVVKVDNITPFSATDITATSSIAGANSLTTAATTLGFTVVISHHPADSYTLTDKSYEYVATADTITNTSGTTSANKQLLVVWHD